MYCILSIKGTKCNYVIINPVHVMDKEMVYEYAYHIENIMFILSGRR